MSQSLSRRSLLTLAAVSLAAASLDTFGLGEGAAAQARAVPIRAIKVSGTRTVTLQAIAPMVADQIGSILGPRYSPGAKGGATLVVDLTLIILDEDAGGTGSLSLPFGRDSGVDQLQGRVSLIGPRREAITSFPLLATSSATYRSVLRMYPDPRRLNGIARAFAWWTVDKLG